MREDDELDKLSPRTRYDRTMPDTRDFTVTPAQVDALRAKFKLPPGNVSPNPIPTGFYYLRVRVRRQSVDRHARRYQAIDGQSFNPNSPLRWACNGNRGRTRIALVWLVAIVAIARATQMS